MNGMKKFALVVLSLLAGGAMLAGFAACEKRPSNVLSTPRNLRIEDEILYWDEVAGAEKYLVSLNDEEFETEEPQFDIFLRTYQPNTYRMSVMAMGDMKVTFDSEASEEIEHVVTICPFLATKTDDGYEIEAAPDLTKGKLVIPERLYDVPVTSVSFEGFADCTELTSVILPDSVTKIGNQAFRDCTNLTRVRIPAFIEEIPVLAFAACSNLWDVKIPNCVEYIGFSAFGANDSLKELKLPASVTKLGDSFFSGKSLERIEVDEENPAFRSEGNCLINRADDSLLLGCRTGKIPYGVKSIGTGAFRGVELIEIEIPNSVTTIGTSAFS